MVKECIRRLNLNRFQNFKRKYTCYCAAVCLLCLLLMVSLFCGLSGYGSLAVLLVRKFPDLMPCFLVLKQIINLNAVLKVGEAVGLCSFLIAWIYAALDKKELGFRYGELLRELYPGYHYFVLLHLVCFAICMWMVKIEKLEPAALALTIVLVDNFLQWKTLKNLILYTENRSKIAIDRWNRLLDEDWQKGRSQRESLLRENGNAAVPQRKNDALLFIIYNLADSLVIDAGGSYEAMQKLFAKAMEQYIEYLHPKTPDEWACTLRDVSKIWGRVQEKAGMDEQELLAIGVLHECAWKACQGALSIGYLLWLYNFRTKQGDTNTASLETLSKEISVLLQQQFNHPSYAHGTSFYMGSAFTLLVWMHFMCGTIGFDRELFKLSPTVPPTEKDRKILKGFAQTVFTQESCTHYLDLVMRQIF